MTNPFRKPEKPEWEDIDGAELWCASCSEVSTKGRVNKERNLVRWACPCGFMNEERLWGG